MHAHDDWAVMLVDDGAVSYDLDGSRHLATSAAVTLLPPGIPHDGRPAVDGQGYRKRVLYFENGWLPEPFRRSAARRPTVPGEVVTMARRVHAAVGGQGDLLAAEHWALELRRHLLTHIGARSTTARDAPLAQRLQALLDDRFTETFTIASVAEEFGTHPSHLTRVFAQAYGIAPHRYLVSRRIDLARRLLLDGHSPATAAVVAGFHDQAHLTRHFRRVLGTTPAAFAGRDRR